MSTLPWNLGLEAPHNWMQSVLRGWTFADSMIVNNYNSRSPGTERKVLDRVSYGRQLGRMMDVLALLVDEREAARGAAPDEHEAAIREFRQLRREIEAIKSEARGERPSRLSAQHLAADLRSLRASDSNRYEEIAAALRPLLMEKSPTP